MDYVNEYDFASYFLRQFAPTSSEELHKVVVSWKRCESGHAIQRNNPFNLTFVKGMPGYQRMVGGFAEFDTLQHGIEATAYFLRFFGHDWRGFDHIIGSIVEGNATKLMQFLAQSAWDAKKYGTLTGGPSLIVTAYHAFTAYGTDSVTPGPTGSIPHADDPETAPISVSSAPSTPSQGSDPMQIIYVDDLANDLPTRVAQMCKLDTEFEKYVLQQRDNGHVLTKDEFENNWFAITLADVAKAETASAGSPYSVPAIIAPGFLPYFGAPASQRNIAWWPAADGGYAEYVKIQAAAQANQICEAAMRLFATDVSGLVAGSTGPGPYPNEALYEAYAETARLIAAGEWTPAPASDLASLGTNAVLPVQTVTPPAAVL